MNQKDFLCRCGVAVCGSVLVLGEVMMQVNFATHCLHQER